MNLMDIKFSNSKGEEKSLKDFKAKAFLIVNTASKCGLTPQYEGLQELYKKYKDQGLEILAFPSNDFSAQEPGTNDEIQEFCQLNFGIEFSVNQKIKVKGEGQHPLFKALTEDKKQSVKNNNGALEKLLNEKGLLTGFDHDIHWNFEKFLVNEKGEIVERFYPDVVPSDERLTTAIEKLISH